MKIACMFGVVLFLSVASLQAEPILTGDNGILDQLYGWENVVEVAPGADTLWGNDQGITVTARGKWAGYTHVFGYLPGECGNDFVPIFTVTGGGYLDGSLTADFTAAQSGATFRFGLDPCVLSTWSSRPGDNSDCGDHMRTFRITGGPSAGNYVLGWEDLPLMLSDRDYQDLVVEVRMGSSVVPEPASLVLLGLSGLACLRRRVQLLTRPRR